MFPLNRYNQRGRDCLDNQCCLTAQLNQKSILGDKGLDEDYTHRQFPMLSQLQIMLGIEFHRIPESSYPHTSILEDTTNQIQHLILCGYPKDSTDLWDNLFWQRNRPTNLLIQ